MLVVVYVDRSKVGHRLAEMAAVAGTVDEVKASTVDHCGVIIFATDKIKASAVNNGIVAGLG